jgi:2-phosphosulfolactate phosphatase
MTVLSTLADKHRLGPVVVVIDVYRSSNTILAALARGARRVMAVAGEDQARTLKVAHPDWIALGERGGIKLDGFDGDNSPCGAPAEAGATVLLTTSGGTRCIDACPADADVVIGSFANARAVIDTLRGGPEPSFWAVGVAGDTAAGEDVLCAQALQDLWQGRSPDVAALTTRLLSCPGAARLRELGQHDDLDYCTAMDTLALVPRRKAWDGLWCFEA